MAALTEKQRALLQALVEAEGGVANDRFDTPSRNTYNGGGWCLIRISGSAGVLTALKDRGLVETYGGDFWRSTATGRAALAEG